MEQKRIRIRTFDDARRRMRTMGLSSLAEFFIMYESANQGLPREEVLRLMRERLGAMRESVEKGKSGYNRTVSGMIDGGAARLGELAGRGGSVLHPFFSQVIQNTLAVAEHNACMGRIVAAPTAGAAGPLPGAFLTVADLHRVDEAKVVEGLFVAGGVGEVIALGASLSGSRHGCQAENGAASAMTAAAIASLFTDDPDVVESAAAFALKNLLGLVCDPVAGLVEVPCAKRCVVAAVNGVACAEMALAGIRTVLPLDEVIGALAAVGNSLPPALRETALGGLAATPTARAIQSKVLLEP